MGGATGAGGWLGLTAIIGLVLVEVKLKLELPTGTWRVNNLNNSKNNNNNNYFPLQNDWLVTLLLLA